MPGFFKEGTSHLWQEAAYGMFAVDLKRNALLIGMADKDKREINAQGQGKTIKEIKK